MSPNPANPLQPEHLQQLNNALDQAKLAMAQIELAKRAGVDVSQAEELNNKNIDKIRTYKQVYFPGQ